METTNTPSTTASRIILPETMSKIERLDRSLLSTDEQFHLDLFLLSYYTGGISLKDLAHLSQDKINSDKLDCSAISYPHVEAITICDKARVIIDRYKDRSSGDYLLPILGKQHKTETQHEGCVKRLSAKANATFRKIEQMLRCGPITWQGARLAFIARLIEEKQPRREIYAFAGSTALAVEAEYIKHPEHMKEIYRQLHKRL